MLLLVFELDSGDGEGFREGIESVEERELEFLGFGMEIATLVSVTLRSEYRVLRECRTKTAEEK